MTRTLSPFVVACPSCASEFSVDPGKVPERGVPAICSTCQRVFPVALPHDRDHPGPGPTSAPPINEPSAEETGVADAPATEAADPPDPAPRSGADDWSPFEDLSSLATEVGAQEQADTDEAPPESAAGSSLSEGLKRFGRRDAHERARHLARVLVSDIIAYHPARYQESLARGTLQEDFEGEVQKSWKEYVDQVGSEMAESTSYFNEALNQVLAKGEDVF